MVAFEATSRPPFLLLEWRFLLYKYKKDPHRANSEGLLVKG